MAKPDLKSLFSFLEPGQQEPKVKVPYRAPAEIPKYDLSKPLMPGEVREVEPMNPEKNPNVDIKALSEKIGGKPKITKAKYDIGDSLNIPFGPDTKPPVQEPAPPAQPDVIDELEGAPAEPPRPEIEELVKKQTEGLDHVEGKQMRNAIVMRDQQETTEREMASDSSVWDEIWPALVPVAVNALMGRGDYEATFKIASDTIDKIQKEKKDWYKLTGAGKTGKAGTDQMALEELRQQGRERLETMRGGGRQQLEGTKAIYKDYLEGTKAKLGGERDINKITAKGGIDTIRDLGKRRGDLEKLYEEKGMDFVTVEHPVTKQHISISKKELSDIPFDQRPKVIQQTRGGSTGLVYKTFVKNNKSITKAFDRITGDLVKTYEHEVGDTSPYLPGASKKQTAGLDPVVKEFRKEATDAIENQKDMIRAITMIRSDNVYENTQAIFTMIKKIEGRMTEEDAKRYTAPLDYWGQLMNEARKKGLGKYDVNLIQGMQNAALKSLYGIEQSYKNLPTKYLKYAQNITQNIDIPDKDKHLAKIFKTPGLQGEEYKKSIESKK